MPPNATPAAQADALAALLDALDVGQIDVVGISAGAASAMQLALRYLEKVKHLVVLVGNLPGSPTAIAQPSWTKRVNRQFVMWALRTFAPSTMVRLVAAVPRGFAMPSDDVRCVIEFIDSLFPMSPQGFNFDLFVSNADVTNYNLEAINVPTLIVHTQDDRLASHEASQRAAGRIPGARFVSLESGGHFMLGHQKKGATNSRVSLPRRSNRFDDLNLLLGETIHQLAERYALSRSLCQVVLHAGVQIDGQAQPGFRAIELAALGFREIVFGFDRSIQRARPSQRIRKFKVRPWPP
jgi:hypothetical protein